MTSDTTNPARGEAAGLGKNVAPVQEIDDPENITSAGGQQPHPSAHQVGGAA